MILRFPVLRGLDSSKFSVEKENVVMRNKMENGLVQTRPRHTRSSRLTFHIGFTDMTQADRVKLEDFWDEVKGGSEAFYWTDPTTKKEHLVRFNDSPLKFIYTGMKGQHAWDCDGVVLEEV